MMDLKERKVALKIRVGFFTTVLYATLWLCMDQVQISRSKIQVTSISKQRVRGGASISAFPRIIFNQNSTSVDLLVTANGSRSIKLETVHLRDFSKLASNDKRIRTPRQIESVPRFINETQELQHCEPMEDWQTTFHPNCNSLHELDLLSPEITYLAKGSIRSVWRVNESSSAILKTLRLISQKVDFDPQRYESHRRDAVISERLTFSPHIVDIYGFCGQSSLNEPMTSGMLPKALKGNLTSIEKLRVAHSASQALVAIHTAGSHDGLVPIIHRDITHRNYLVSKDGTVKLNDFNVGRFAEWDSASHTFCEFRKPDCGPYRSPEECNNQPLTEKIDIYSFGHILYFILTGHAPYTSPNKLSISQIKQSIKEGNHSTIKEQYLNSTDPATQNLVHLILKCWEHNPQDRPSAVEIQNQLSSSLNKSS